MASVTRPHRVVIVGAGSAGAVLAARLTERPDIHVTLLEAGPDHRQAGTPDTIAGPSFVAAMGEAGRTWPNLTATRAAGQTPRQYVRGRGVGGSSAINAMVALAGHPDDYNEWAGRYGCAGWAWTDVRPWFARTALQLNRAPQAEWGDVNLAMARAIPAAAKGVELTRSPAGRRVSVNDAYLEPARDRPNLDVVGDALVDRVTLVDRRATGVALADGRHVEADVVMISAGAIHSPALLLRSGVDTPGIGDNLHDHPSFPIALSRREPADVGTLPIATVAKLSSPGTVDDLQLLPLDYVDASAPHLAMMMAALMRSYSRGSVRLAGNDPDLDPVVEFNMMSDERDRAPMNAAIDAAEQTLAHAAFAGIVDVLPYDRSDAGVLASLGDYVHVAGTCAMGTVVDIRCGVVGYRSLMVCDASVMPVAPRANTHLPVVMIAERIAERLRTELPHH
jgi:choline dehydrogenase-like flavoprotein